MAEPTGTIEPIPFSSTPLMDRFYDYTNQPLNTEDPLQNLVSGVADFIPGLSTALAKRRGDKLGEALSYLDYIPGGGIPAEAVSFAVKRAKLLQKLKREREIQGKTTDPIETAASQKEEVKLLKQIKKMDADKAKSPGTRITEASDTMSKNLQDIGFPLKTKQGELFGIRNTGRGNKELADATKKSGRKPPPGGTSSTSISDDMKGIGALVSEINLSKKLGGLNLENKIIPSLTNQNTLYHGSRINDIPFYKDKNLTIPTQRGKSTGGIYTASELSDPRLLANAGTKGSVYTINPNFKNVFDIDDIVDPRTFKGIQQNKAKGNPVGERLLEMFNKNESIGPTSIYRQGYRGKNNVYDPELSSGIMAMLKGLPGTGRTPSGFSKDMALPFLDEGYDAIRFPKRPMRGESDTVISLDPKNLEIGEQINPEDISELIKLLSFYK